MIKLYQDPIFGSQYYIEEIKIESVNIVPDKYSFSVEKWRELTVQCKPLLNRKILKPNRRNEQDH